MDLILPLVSTIIITKKQPKEHTLSQGDSLIESMSVIVLDAGNILTTNYYVYTECCMKCRVSSGNLR